MQTLRILGLSVAAVATLTAGAATSAVLDRTAPLGAQGAAAQPATTAVSPPTTADTVAPPPMLTTPSEQARVVGASESATGTLRPGDSGPRTVELQKRLVALGYWLGDPDGKYGDLTVQAVIAFQKVHGMERDGVAGPAVAATLASPSPAGAGGGLDRIEIDKRRQVLLAVRDGAVRWVLNVSTGTERPYRANGRTELADTPAGQWSITREHDGVKVGELGAIYRPRYFHRDGIAVHGYHSVPSVPASHGCVRVSKPAMDWIWSTDLMPIGTPVWVY